MPQNRMEVTESPFPEGRHGPTAGHRCLYHKTPRPSRMNYPPHKDPQRVSRALSTAAGAEAMATTKLRIEDKKGEEQSMCTPESRTGTRISNMTQKVRVA